MAETWLDKMLGRVREAPTMDAARMAVKDYMDPATGERVEGADPDGDTHIHLHMNGKGGEAGARDDDPGLNPDNNGEPDLGDLAAQVAELTQRVAQLESTDEEDVELEGENEDGTKDARRFKLRRRDKMGQTHDEGEGVPVPERKPDIIGETDLPGIEDLDKRMPTATGDAKRAARRKFLSTHDSADVEDLWKDTMANVEIIAPGIRIPTFDARLPIGRSAERMCGIRRRALEHGFKDAETSEIIAETVGIKTFDGVKVLSCDSVKMAFNAVANAMRANNNAGVTRTAVEGGTGTRDGAGKSTGAPSLAAMNKMSDEFWSKQKTNGAIRR